METLNGFKTSLAPVDERFFESEYMSLGPHHLEKLRGGLQHIPMSRWKRLGLPLTHLGKMDLSSEELFRPVKKSDYEAALLIPATRHKRKKKKKRHVSTVKQSTQATKQPKPQPRAATNKSPKLSYEEYLESPLWKAIRNLVLVRADHVCCCCDMRAIQVHHENYSRETMLGIRTDKLHAICRGCHYEIEFTDGVKNSLPEANKKLKRKIAVKREVSESVPF